MPPALSGGLGAVNTLPTNVGYKFGLRIVGVKKFRKLI